MDKYTLVIETADGNKQEIDLGKIGDMDIPVDNYIVSFKDEAGNIKEIEVDKIAFDKICELDKKKS